MEKFPDAYYVTEALVIWENPNQEQIPLILEKEVFAPVANLIKVGDLNHAKQIIRHAESRLSGGFYGSLEDYEHLKDEIPFGSLHYCRAAKDDSPTGIHAQKGGYGSGITGGLESIEQYMNF